MGLLEVDGSAYEEDLEVDHVVHFYGTLYQETEGWSPTVDGLEFNALGKRRVVCVRGCLRGRRSYW